MSKSYSAIPAGPDPLAPTPSQTVKCWCAAKKKSTKINFLGPETARGGGDLPREGVVAEKFVPSLKSFSSLGFEERNQGCPGNFAGMSRTSGGVQKVFAKKVRAHFSFTIGVQRSARHRTVIMSPCTCLCLLFVHWPSVST